MKQNLLDINPPKQTDLPLRQLKELPGPPTIPLLGNVLQVQLPHLHQNLEQWAKTYGSIYKVHLGQTKCLVLSDHELITTLLRDRPDGFRRPQLLYQVLEEMNIKPGLFSAEGQDWQNQRRMVMSSFSPSNVRRFFPLLLRVTQRLQNRWQQTIGNASSGYAIIDLQLDLMRFTVDVISGLAFGKDINTLEAKEEVIQKHLDKILPAVFQRVNALLPYWRLFKLPKDRALDRSIQVVNQAIHQFIAQARAGMVSNPHLREQPSNLLEAMIVAAEQTGSAVSDDDVVGNVFTMLIAGEDTTANSMAWLIYLLSQNPQAMARAQAEAHRIISGDVALLTPEKVASMDYIEACTHEAMRLKPVGPLNVLEALHDTVVADVIVPVETVIIGLMRHDAVSEKYFQQASDFKPERWLEGEGLLAASNAKRVSMPFGSGPRVCPGRYLALMEIKLGIAMLLDTFDIVAVQTPNEKEVQEHLSFTMSPLNLVMHIKPRSKQVV